MFSWKITKSNVSKKSISGTMRLTLQALMLRHAMVVLGRDQGLKKELNPPLNNQSRGVNLNLGPLNSRGGSGY